MTLNHNQPTNCIQGNFAHFYFCSFAPCTEGEFKTGGGGIRFSINWCSTKLDSWHFLDRETQNQFHISFWTKNKTGRIQSCIQYIEFWLTAIMWHKWEHMWFTNTSCTTTLQPSLAVKISSIVYLYSDMILAVQGSYQYCVPLRSLLRKERNIPLCSWSNPGDQVCSKAIQLAVCTLHHLPRSLARIV